MILRHANNSLFFLMVIYLWLNSLQELLPADCSMVRKQIFTTPTDVSEQFCSANYKDKSTVGEMTGAAGLQSSLCDKQNI